MTTPTLQSYSKRPKIEGIELIDLVRHIDDGGSMTELGRVTPWAQYHPGMALEAACSMPIGSGKIDLAQINYSEIEPGVIKAFHLHKRQTDVWFVPPSDRMLVVLFRTLSGDGWPLGPRQDEQSEPSARFVLGAGRSQLLLIPPGVAHGVRNIGSGTGRIVYFTNLHFNPNPTACDEFRLPWDYLGAEIWEISKG